MGLFPLSDVSPWVGTGNPSTHPLFLGELPDPSETNQSPGAHYVTGQSSFLGPETPLYRNSVLKQPVWSPGIFSVHLSLRPRGQRH